MSLEVLRCDICKFITFSNVSNKRRHYRRIHKISLPTSKDFRKPKKKRLKKSNTVNTENTERKEAVPVKTPFPISKSSDEAEDVINFGEITTKPLTNIVDMIDLTDSEPQTQHIEPAAGSVVDLTSASVTSQQDVKSSSDADLQMLLDAIEVENNEPQTQRKEAAPEATNTSAIGTVINMSTSNIENLQHFENLGEISFSHNKDVVLSLDPKTQQTAFPLSGNVLQPMKESDISNDINITVVPLRNLLHSLDQGNQFINANAVCINNNTHNNNTKCNESDMNNHNNFGGKSRNSRPMSDITNNMSTTISSSNSNINNNIINTNFLQASSSGSGTEKFTASDVDLSEFAEWKKIKNDQQNNTLVPSADGDQSFLNSLHPYLKEMSAKQNRQFRRKVLDLIDNILDSGD